MTSTPTPPAVRLDPSLTSSTYASLRTFRRDGTPVDCPVWFGWSQDGATVWFRSKADTGKIRRLVADPRVELRPCSWRGRIRPGTPIMTGSAAVIDPVGDAEETDRATARLRARYGWKWSTVPLFRVPFTNTVAVDLSLRQKLKLARTGGELPASCLVAVAVDVQAAAWPRS